MSMQGTLSIPPLISRRLSTIIATIALGTLVMPGSHWRGRSFCPSPAQLPVPFEERQDDQ